MTDKKKLSFDERLHVVKHCLDHGLDYKGTAIRFGISYNQVYSWTKKYQERGENGLIDKRGIRKKPDEMTSEELEIYEEKQKQKDQLKKEQEEELIGALSPYLNDKRTLQQKKYELIRRYHDERGWSILWMCSLFKIGRSSYYKWNHARKRRAREE